VQATGFTGQLIAAYLRQRCSGAWAIAGRNKKKLDEIKLSLLSDNCSVLVLDVSDQKSVDAVVSQARGEHGSAPHTSFDPHNDRAWQL
jgi:short subunit dehydrogenase-like uncharacterized protein